MVYLIDYENVRNLRGVGGLKENDKVIVFYTKNANMIAVDDHVEIQNSKASVDFKQVHTGKNALDFQLSSYLGFLVGQNIEGICVISKDTGFDCVIDFWAREKNITIYKQPALVIQENEQEQEKTGLTEKKSKVKNRKSNQEEPSTDLKTVLTKNAHQLQIEPSEIEKIVKIVSQYKTKNAINTNIQKTLKVSSKAGSVQKLIKPFLKGKN